MESNGSYLHLTPWALADRELSPQVLLAGCRGDLLRAPRRPVAAQRRLEQPWTINPSCLQSFMPSVILYTTYTGQRDDYVSVHA